MAADEPARGQRPLAEASEEDWRRREETRQAIVAAIKDSPDYRALQASRRPGTPDPNDRMTSKRNWETKVTQWRTALKCLSQLEKEESQLLIATTAEFSNAYHLNAAQLEVDTSSEKQMARTSAALGKYDPRLARYAQDLGVLAQCG